MKDYSTVFLIEKKAQSPQEFAMVLCDYHDAHYNEEADYNRDYRLHEGSTVYHLGAVGSQDDKARKILKILSESGPPKIPAAAFEKCVRARLLNIHALKDGEWEIYQARVREKGCSGIK